MQHVQIAETSRYRIQKKILWRFILLNGTRNGAAVYANHIKYSKKV